MRDSPNPARKSVAVHGSIVRELRKRCRWTQDDLAERTGLSDRSVRSAEAGRPVHFQTVSKLCEVFNRELMLSLSPQQLFESSVCSVVPAHDSSSQLSRLIGCMFSKVQNFRLEDLLDEGVVYSCEVGTLLGIVEVERRFSALRISCLNHDVDVLELSGSGDYAAASWALRQYDRSASNAVIAEQSGCTCIRMNSGLIVEAWDFPACKAQLDAVAKVPPNSQLRQSVKVNGDLVRAHRIAQAMTQEELARKSDLSIRLIRSVEKSKEVSQRSCRMIATALTVPCSTLEVPGAQAATQSLMARRAKEYLEEVWNHENYTVIDTHLTNKFRFHHEVGVVCDRREMKQRIIKFRESFGDFDFNVTSALDFGTFVVCKWQVKMTHVGPWLGIAPTGVRVRVNGASWVHVVDEQFGDAWDFWNPELVLSRLRKA